MGYYIEAPTAKGKTEFIVNNLGGVEVPQPKSFEEIPADKALIVVLDNGPFEAAGLAFSPGEFWAFTLPHDIRSKRFVLLDRKTAYVKADYKDGIRDEFGGKV